MQEMERMIRKPAGIAALAGSLALAVMAPAAVADTTEPPALCSWSFGRWSTADGQLSADLRARAIAADGRILAYRLRDDVDAEALLLDLGAGLGGGDPQDAEHWIVEDTGRAVPPADVARIAALAREVRDGPLDEPPPPEAYADVGLELLSCTVPAADGIGWQAVTIRVTGDTTVTNRHPRAAALAEELAAILDAAHMLAP